MKPKIIYFVVRGVIMKSTIGLWLSIKKYKLLISQSIILVGLYFLFSNYEIKFADSFYIKNPSAAIEILSIISTILATLFGIALAFLILSVELLRKAFSNYGIKIFLDNPILKSLVVKFFIGLIISLITLVKIENSSANVSIIIGNLVNLNLLYLFYFIGSILISSKKIILQSTSKQLIKDIVKRITIEDYRSFNYRINDKSKKENDYVKIYEKIENHPLYQLRDIAINNIKDGDRYIPLIILDEIFEDLLRRLNDNVYHRRDTINSYIYIISNIVKYAINEKKEYVIVSYIRNFEKLHVYCADNKYKWSELIELNSEFQSNINSMLEQNIVDPASSAFYSLMYILIYNIKNNIPAEDKLKMLLYKYERKEDWGNSDTDSEVHWDNITKAPIGIMNGFTENIIKLNNVSLMYSHIYAMRSYLFELYELKNIGNMQKSYLMERVLTDIYYITSEYSKNKLPSGYVLNPIGEIDIILFTREKSYHRKNMVIIFRNFIWGLVNSKIISSYCISDIGILAIMYIPKIREDDFYIEAIYFLLQFIDEIRQELEGTSDEEVKKTLIFLFNNLKHMQEKMYEEQITNKIISDKIISVQEGFKNIEAIQNNSIVIAKDWPNLDELEKQMNS